MNINDRVTVKNDALRLTILWTIRNSSEATEAIAQIEAEGGRLLLAVWPLDAAR